jgi:hypothetical protein
MRMVHTEAARYKKEVPGEYFTDLSSYRAHHSKEFEQPQEISDRAATLIINCLARYPQAGDSAFTIAESLINEFDPKPQSRTGIGILEASRMDPDPYVCANQINRLHTAFSIPRVVSPAEAGYMVCFMAGSALEFIRHTTFVATLKGGITAPQEVYQPLILGNPSESMGPWSFDRRACEMLSTYLTDTPAVRERVTVDIRSQAQKVHAKSRSQQEKARLKIPANRIAKKSGK